MPHGFRNKVNAFCVIIIGFLNHGYVVYFIGTGVGWTGSVDSSKIVGSSNNDGKFFTCVLSHIVILC